MNSYLGILRHFKSHKLRTYYLLEKLSKRWFLHFLVNNNFTKFNKLKVPKDR